MHVSSTTLVYILSFVIIRITVNHFMLDSHTFLIILSDKHGSVQY